ncbi:MAG: aspartate/glutamate racemase family protein [Ignavibacteriota bacterium]
MKTVSKQISLLLLSLVLLATVTGNTVYSQSTDSLKNTEMKVIGIIGGVSWASSIDYYKLMNEMVRDRFGSLYSANILMYSIPFKEFSDQERLAEAGDWKPIINMMIESAKRLERGGADFIVIASNTMNSTIEELEKHVKIPFLHIADATGEKIKEKGLKKVALLGTKFTMEHKFYKERLQNKFGLEVVIPSLEERDYINKVIFDELCNNYIVVDSKVQYLKIINRLIKEEGVEGVILGCTEIPMIVKQEDVLVPVFNTTVIHSEAAVNYSVGLKQIIK